MPSIPFSVVTVPSKHFECPWSARSLTVGRHPVPGAFIESLRGFRVGQGDKLSTDAVGKTRISAIYHVVNISSVSYSAQAR